MEEHEIIYLASKCFDKNWSFEQLKYCDDLYGKESFADEIWEFVAEIKEIGKANFKEQFKEFKLYF